MHDTNKITDNVSYVFGKFGETDYRLDKAELAKYFTEDFQMIAFGKKICDFDGLIEHINHMRDQIGNCTMCIHETVSESEKVVIRYDLISDKKPKGYVIAIFKYRDDNRIYEMNEVFSLGREDIDITK